MQCDEVAAHLADYLADTLTAPTRDEIDRHAAACAACRSELDGTERTWQRLIDLPVPVPDSARMRARFEAVLEQHAGALASAPMAPIAGWWQLLGWPGRLGMAAAAFALLAAGVGFGRLMSPAPAPATDVAALRDEIREMRIMVGLSLMQQSSASERLKGVSWSGQIDRPRDELVTALLDTLMHDPNDNVRLATVDALRRFADRDLVRRGAVEALARQRSPLVQIALIDFVVETNGREAVDTLRRLSNDDTLNEAVRTRATLAIERLS